MLRDIDVAVLQDRLHDAGERLDGWDVAVDQLECLPVGWSDSHLEADRTDDRIADDTAHFETPHLSEHDAVLDDGSRPRLNDQVVEQQVLGVSGRGSGDRFGDRREQ